MNTATYVVNHPVFGRLVFGGHLEENEDRIEVSPRESAKSRIFLASKGVWLTLDAGTRYTPKARLRIDYPGEAGETGAFDEAGESVESVETGELRPVKNFSVERGAYVIPLNDRETRIRLID